jgi:hypothetical protein
LIFQCTEQLLVVRHGRDAIPDGEWSALLRTLEQQPLNHMKILVLTDGGGPSPAQQLAVAKLTARISFTVAVLSDSVGMRFVVSSVALLVRRIRTFTSAELPGAAAFLELSPTELRTAETFFARTAK